MNLENITKLRIEHPENRGNGAITSIVLKTGKAPGIRGRNYEVASDGKGELCLAVRDDVTVVFPEDNSLMNARIDIKKGDVTVADMKGLKDLMITGTVGDTEIKGVSAEKLITVRSMEGVTVIRDTDTSKLITESMSGDVSVSGDIDRIEAETISGNISIDAGTSGNISISSIAGDMKVKAGTIPEVEYSGLRNTYSGPESDERSKLKIKASVMSGSLTVRT